MPDVADLITASPEQHGLVVAGPGAGKSDSIGKRVDFLRSHGVMTSEIVLLTLTNATARTLRNRFPAVPVRTRLWPMRESDRSNLVNWGYLTSDVVVRSYVPELVDAAMPSAFPFPGANFKEPPA